MTTELNTGAEFATAEEIWDLINGVVFYYGT